MSACVPGRLYVYCRQTSANSGRVFMTWTWLDALKYGPIAIAALTAFWAAGLMTIELRRAKVRSDARNLLVIFMSFSLLLTALSWGLTIYDDNSKRKYDLVVKQRLADIGVQVGQLDSSLVAKHRHEIADPDANASTRNFLISTISTMCTNLLEIARLAETSMLNNCAEVIAGRVSPPNTR